MSSKNRSSSSKIHPLVCSFCNLTEDNELEYGKIYEHNGIVTHYYCLLLSSNMEQKGNDDEGILGFLAEDIQKELRRGKRLVCSYCKKQGATLGCCNVRCKRIFHFPCGMKAGSLHQFFGEFRSYCINHRPKQKIDEQVLKQAAAVDVMCYICYDKVNTNDFVKTLWAPCCKKDAWFHRICVQQLALSAGYFFKCPLCNNKKDFQKSMLEYGIFVPSQDASWELEPNAFEELLYRHDQCDAPKCVCPKGRKYTSTNAKWELVLCRTCGSQGIHMSCGQLKWANPVWECEECTSILSNDRVKLGNSSAIGSTSQNRDSDSDLNSDSDSDSDSQSNTDISVGTDFPMPCALTDSSSTSSLESILDNINLRPGPRSFKLQQQMIKLGQWLDLTSTVLEKNIAAIETSTKDELLSKNESLSKNDDEKKEPSISKENKESKENILQRESKEDSFQKEKQLHLQRINKEDSPQKEKQLPSKNDEKSQPIQKKTDVIIIESDDDDVELITLTQKTNLSSVHMKQPIQFSSLCLPSTSTLKKLNATVVSNNVATIDLLEKDYIDLTKSIASERKASKKNASTISKDQIDVGTSQESTLDLITLNDVKTNTKETSEMSFMNIKITNVVSLPPEVFESVPDVICNDITLHANTTNTSPLSINETLEQFVTSVSSKRSMHEASNINNCKKIKRNNFDERLHETCSRVGAIESDRNKTNNTQNDAKNSTNNIDRQQSERTSANKFIPLLSNNPANNSSSQHNYIQIKANDMQHMNQILSNLEGNTVHVNLNQRNENHVTQAKNTTEFITFTKTNPVLLPIGSYYLQQIPNSNFTIEQNDGRNETNLYDISSNNVILPRVTDNTTVLSNSTVLSNPLLVNQPIMTNVTAPILSDKRIVTVNQQEAASSKDVLTSTPSIENISTNKATHKKNCDGDAGTRPVETESTNYKKADPSNYSHSVFDKQTIARQRSIATCSVFPQITNNHTTCHRPGLIPRYVNLQDLKFRVCASNNIEMILYDTFSVNISMKDLKESKRLAGVAASREAKEMSTIASCEAYSSEYIDNITTERRTDKLFRSLKNENFLINDKMYIAHSQDDVKENLNPIRSRVPSHNDTLDNMNSTNNVDSAMNNCFKDENDSETCLVSSDTNVSVLNRTICNTNVDTIVPLISNQGSQVSLETVQQHKQASIHSVISMHTEERSRAQLFFKETNRIVYSVDFDLNNMNKNIEKISQNDITILSQHTDDDKIGNDHTDDSLTSQNGLKNLNSMNSPKINNVTRVSNITRFNEHSILSKQIDACNSKNFIQCIAFQENTVRRNGETRIKNNEFCLKVSIDLCKIQNLIDSKPELFKDPKHMINGIRTQIDYLT
ncbi:PREDICTED: probable GPI-anchored adhesin-like protein PGA55 isoform X1 [Trachymyrmex septentrionalis]|uniref:probable GPI-anchored adhesin-like protein PGA55 isoform X1 n=1 Tax=Trachymyrmex septentrionalis TaxID=34720 RepID=UPI00084EE114|nr:PREDICTED: probable GPI-anchored adhesin-like protein PGA55 isoform X1 [Trachymyrmex septentrionalis]